MQTVKTDSAELRVAERGAGKPLVLVHGFPLDHSMWDEQLDHFSQRWRVIAPDLRGFGASQVTPGTVTMEDMADDVVAVLDALGVDEPVVFCGLSMGGYVALQFWRKYAARLRGLVLCDTRAVADSPEGVALRQKMIGHVLRAGTEYAAEAMLPKLFAPATFANRPEVVEFELQKILAASPEGIAAALRGLAVRPDAQGYLPQIGVPTQVIVGELDAISPVDEMRGIAAEIPNAEFVVIPGSGHMTPMESPAAFNAALEKFLDRVDG